MNAAFCAPIACSSRLGMGRNPIYSRSALKSDIFRSEANQPVCGFGDAAEHFTATVGRDHPYAATIDDHMSDASSVDEKSPRERVETDIEPEGWRARHAIKHSSKRIELGTDRVGRTSGRRVLDHVGSKRDDIQII